MEAVKFNEMSYLLFFSQSILMDLSYQTGNCIPGRMGKQLDLMKINSIRQENYIPSWVQKKPAKSLF